MAPCVGEWVEVRSREEILSTLDARGRLDGLPFMPQMFDFCGRRFQIYKSAHKTCDTVNVTGGRKLPGGVHLENLRCNGDAYGGCEAACLIFWNKAWLKAVDGPFSSIDEKGVKPVLNDKIRSKTRVSENAVSAGTLAMDQPASGSPKYSCQATDLPIFTKPLYWWDARQYVEDYTTGNASLRRLAGGFLYAAYYYLSRPGRPQLDPIRMPFRWLYDRAAKVCGGTPFPRRSGTLPKGRPAPNLTLDLQPGDLVRVKPYEEILATLNEHNKNRGLYFDAEMVPFCGRIYRVRSRVSQFINEQTGQIVFLKTPAVILENGWCRASYSDRRMQCPRSIYAWWRETWLERVPEKEPVPDKPPIEVRTPVLLDA